MQHIDGFDIEAIPTWSVLFASTTPEDYEMERLIIAEQYEGEWQKYVVAQAGHCSCYEFDDAKWDAWIVDKAGLFRLARGWATGEDLERAAAQFLRRYLGERQWGLLEAAAKRTDSSDSSRDAETREPG